MIGAIGWSCCFTVYAETWPPLKPPSPLSLEWVVKQVFTRFPETHAKHRAYLAALERVPRGGDSDPRVQIGRQDAERVRLQALEHHLMLQWQATQEFYNFALADKSIALLENHKRLIDAYIPAFKSRMGKRSGARDLAPEAARLHAELLKLQYQRLEAMLKLNMLMDHRLEAVLPSPSLGVLSLLPADQDDLIKKALEKGVPMRMAQVEIMRSVSRFTLRRAPSTIY
ncbi:MAG: hypothetical protein HY052_05245 [Proteobacteria bacterium]|nr:hypothetical protein [Pseudomonadota bacterium]